MSIGENIRKNRRKKDIKAEEVFERIGVSQSTYSKIENDRCKIDIETLQSIAVVLEVDITILLGGEEKITENANLETLIKLLENKIELLKEQNSLLKQKVFLLKNEQ